MSPIVAVDTKNEKSVSEKPSQVTKKEPIKSKTIKDEIKPDKKDAH